MPSSNSFAPDARKPRHTPAQKKKSAARKTAASSTRKDFDAPPAKREYSGSRDSESRGDFKPKSRDYNPAAKRGEGRSEDRRDAPRRDDRREAPRRDERSSAPRRDDRRDGPRRDSPNREAPNREAPNRQAPGRENRSDYRGGQRSESRGDTRNDRSGGYNRDDRRDYKRDDAGDARSKARSRDDRVERDQSRERSFSDARKSSSSGKSFEQDTVLDRLESIAREEVEHFETFQQMDLPEKLVTELAKMGAATPFPIQAATIPAAMSGREVLGRGKTGSGKTIAFGVPMITKLAAQGNQPRNPGRPKALVLAPTRELADQIETALKPLAKSVGFFTTCIYGGVPQRKQEIALNRGVDILIATPGRLEDLIAQRLITLDEVETVVVDEADHMSELGFIEPLRRILELTGDSQKLLFSATLDRAVDSIVKKFMKDPFVYEVPGEDQESSDITHRVLVIDPNERSAVLHRLVQGQGRSIIFVRTRVTAERLSESLTENGVPAARLHGDLNQGQRNRNLERFKSGAARVMVATDVAARGIHVDDVKLVIQLDLPEEYKTYLHRAGRTGRAGRSGDVISLVPAGRLRKVESLLQRADRQAEFTVVKPGSALLEELAGPISPPSAATSLDFGDSRFDNSTGNKGAKKQLRSKYQRR